MTLCQPFTWLEVVENKTAADSGRGHLLGRCVSGGGSYDIRKPEVMKLVSFHTRENSNLPPIKVTLQYFKCSSSHH